ncbi:hypothetical protein OEZ86_004755 [Tetradesmus obliquus]|nr:hypothetical protein OEZ86_004755 [Tetradesmus obliquus]
MLSLQELRLPNNNLSGSLPDSFANMKQLRVFDVSQSAPQHSGGIEGRLPAKWAALQNLKVLNVAGNKVGSSMPTSYAGLLQLQVLNASSNVLQGTLPQAWVALRHLAILDLRNNMLNVTIPPLWDNFAGDGFELQCLLLSPNDGMVLDQATKANMVDKAQGRAPPLGLVVDDATSASCQLDMLE